MRCLSAFLSLTLLAGVVSDTIAQLDVRLVRHRECHVVRSGQFLRELERADPGSGHARADTIVRDDQDPHHAAPARTTDGALNARRSSSTGNRRWSPG